MAKPDLKDYVEVADRIKAFKEAHPEGSLQSIGKPWVEHHPDGKAFIWYGAMAYRSPDDPKPGVGWAQEPFPGLTPYTKNSELQNAETSAWGRAIAALGFDFNGKVASREEVRNRQAEGEGIASESRPGESGAKDSQRLTGAPSSPTLTKEQVEALTAYLKGTGIDSKSVGYWLAVKDIQPARVPAGLKVLTEAQAVELKDWVKGELEEKAA